MMSFYADTKIPMKKILFNWIICVNLIYTADAQGVGIGMSHPSARLHVAGYSSGTYPMLALTDSGTNTFPGILFNNPNSYPKWSIAGALTGTASNDFFNIYYGGSPPYSTYFSINGNGQIGCGTMTQNNWLQVGNVPNIFSGNQLALGNGSQGMSFAQYSNTSTWYSNTGFSLMPNTGNGFVGIGTQAPAAPLHVYSSATANTIVAEQSNTGNASILFKNSNGNAFLLTSGTSSGTDVLNMYSSTLGANMLKVTTQSNIYSAQPTGTIVLSGIAAMYASTIVGPAYITLADGSVYNNWLLPNATAVNIQDNGASASGITITGFDQPFEGRIVYLYSSSSVPITIKRYDPRSTLAFQVNNPGGDIILHYGYCVTLIYINGAWNVFSKNF